MPSKTLPVRSKVGQGMRILSDRGRPVDAIFPQDIRLPTQCLQTISPSLGWKRRRQSTSLETESENDFCHQHQPSQPPSFVFNRFGGSIVPPSMAKGISAAEFSVFGTRTLGTLDATGRCRTGSSPCCILGWLNAQAHRPRDSVSLSRIFLVLGLETLPSTC